MNISVIGAGQMGNGIAHVFAQAGHQVVLIDIAQSGLDKGMATIAKNLDRQVAKGSLRRPKQAALGASPPAQTRPKGVKRAELVVEAATENVDLKLQIFREIDANAPAGCILATNTSSISITRIAAATGRPAQVIGMHFMNPVPVMKLVEVIRGYDTTDAVTRTVMELSRAIGKVPVEVNDYAGFVANRILMPMINEAIETLFQGVGGVAGDRHGDEAGHGAPHGSVATGGLHRLDTCLAILRVLHDGLRQAEIRTLPLAGADGDRGQTGREERGRLLCVHRRQQGTGGGTGICQGLMRNATFLPLAGLAWLCSCGTAGTSAGSSEQKTEDLPSAHCYLSITVGQPRVEGQDTVPGAVDSMWLKVNVLGDLVNGTYRWQPQEKDAKMGSFTGTLENGTITALLSYEAEGRPGQEEMVMKVDSGGLRIGSGERVEEQGIWLFKDKGALAFGPLVPETTCP
jgi:3-hydroxybutyryl-CoA dehydrogenase